MYNVYIHMHAPYPNTSNSKKPIVLSLLFDAEGGSLKMPYHILPCQADGPLMEEALWARRREEHRITIGCRRFPEDAI